MSHSETKADRARKRELRLEVGMRVRVSRELAGLTQEQLARKARIGRSTLVNMEFGRHLPGLDVLERLAKAMGIKTRTLIGL